MVEGNECFHVLLHVWLLKDSIKVSAFILNGFDELVCCRVLRTHGLGRQSVCLFLAFILDGFDE
jgi:hypothetical protein